LIFPGLLYMAQQMSKNPLVRAEVKRFVDELKTLGSPPPLLLLLLPVSPGRVSASDIIELDVGHSHSPAVIPFGVTDVPLLPIHNAPFLQAGTPVFNTHHVPEATSPLVNTPAVGRALAATMAQHTVVLMRGHGNTVVGPDIRETVARAIYTEVNARAPAGSSEWGAPSSISTPAKRKKWHAR
jgi:HCOMODA/2-hydroxy-3-carboxy-muconic semialdehyde decarboxylase